MLANYEIYPLHLGTGDIWMKTSGGKSTVYVTLAVIGQIRHSAPVFGLTPDPVAF